MAGATQAAVVASRVAVRRLSAKPNDSLARVLALSGATITRSTAAASCTWGITSPLGAAHVSVPARPGECAKGQRSHEASRSLRHHHIDLGARLDQLAAKIGSLVGCDAARHAQEDPLAAQQTISHSTSFSIVGRRIVTARRPRSHTIGARVLRCYNLTPLIDGAKHKGEQAPMVVLRIVNLARVMTEYSVGIRPGDRARSRAQRPGHPGSARCSGRSCCTADAR